MHSRQQGKDLHWIGLDLGTSAIKGARLQTDGTVLKTASRPVHYQHPGPNRVEADAENFYTMVIEVIRELVEADPTPVGALAAAAASGNTLLADAQGRPLTPIINWMDQRATEQPLEPLQGLTKESVLDTVGWPCVTSFPLAHLAWIKEHHPEVLAQADHVGMNTDWLLYRLSGHWRMDYSTATTFHLQNQTQRSWHLPYLERLGIDESKLSTLVDCGTVAGPLTAQAAKATGCDTKTLVVTGSFDHPAGARGVGILEPGQLLLSCGTSWVGFTPCHDRRALLEANMLCDPFLSSRGGPWAGIFSVPAIGPVIDWYLDNLIAPGEANRLAIFDDLASKAPPGAGGLEIDLREPPKAIDADRALISRAVMEGAARALNAHLQRLKSHGFHFSQAILIGGPSKSPIWPDIIKAETGLHLEVGTAHAGAKGAAMLAAQGAGIRLGSPSPFDETLA